MASGAPNLRFRLVPRPAREPSYGLVERRGTATTSYNGPDRRTEHLAAGLGPSPTACGLAGGLIVATIALSTVLGHRGDQTAATELAPRLADAVLDGMAIACAVAAAIVARQRWKVRRDVLSIAVGTALSLVGALVVLEPLVEGYALAIPQPSPLAAGGRLAIMAVVGHALVGPEVRSRARFSTSLLGYGALAAAIAVVLSVPVVREHAFAPGSAWVAALIAAIVLGWLALAARSGRAGMLRRSPIHTWIGVAMLALALSDIALFTYSDATGQTFGRAVRLGGIIAALHALAVELRQMLVVHTSLRLEARHVLARTIDRLVQQSQRHSEVIHDASSALLAIQGAIGGLEHDAHDEAHQARVIAALQGEVARLRSLVTTQPEPVRLVPFDLVALVEPMVVCYQASGQPVSVAVSRPEVVAVGRPGDTGEVVQNLIDNALRHAAGTPVHVGVAVRDGHAHVSVSDGGPGIDPTKLDRVVEWGYQGDPDAATGSGLGLFVALRLMEQQGGELTLANRPLGGLRCDVELPLAASGTVAGTVARAVALTVAEAGGRTWPG